MFAKDTKQPPHAVAETPPEDGFALWDNFTRRVTPYRRVRETQRVPDRIARAHKKTATVKPEPAAVAAVPEKRHLNEISPSPSIDRNTQRKIKSGKKEIEAVLDLHGMREAEAHAAFNRFIKRCCGAGMRTVIVITGKGTGPQSEGKLKNALPAWAEMPGIGPLILGYSFALPKDGGTGARYILLRRSKK